MADRGQITGGVLDGPLAFDNAIDMEAARIKGIKSEVAGRAQILVVPDLESGNMLAKNLAYFAKADGAGIVLGARVPIVLTSRADFAAGPDGVLRGRNALSPMRDGGAARRCRGVTAMDTILVVNAGSSSVKFQVFAVEAMARCGGRSRARWTASAVGRGCVPPAPRERWPTGPIRSRRRGRPGRAAGGGRLVAGRTADQLRWRSDTGWCMAARNTTGRC